VQTNDSRSRSSIVVVSPHLDDAILSASHLLMNADCTVLTIFAGPPANSVSVTPWDLITGSVSSAQRYQERITEDERAVAVIGAKACRLHQPELGYRGGEPIDLADCVSALTTELEGAAAAWIPAGLGQHPDHLLARDLALNAACGAGVPTIGFYADVPYVVEYGWPTWITKCPPDPYLSPDTWLSLELAHVGLNNAGLTPFAVKLKPEERILKARAVSEYRTQLAGLHLDDHRRGVIGDALDYELRWTVPSSQLPSLVHASVSFG